MSRLISFCHEKRPNETEEPIAYLASSFVATHSYHAIATKYVSYFPTTYQRLHPAFVLFCERWGSSLGSHQATLLLFHYAARTDRNEWPSKLKLRAMKRKRITFRYRTQRHAISRELVAKVCTYLKLGRRPCTVEGWMDAS